jgi:hypothetical protein
VRHSITSSALANNKVNHCYQSVTEKQHVAETIKSPGIAWGLRDESGLQSNQLGWEDSMKRVALISTVMMGVGFAQGALAADLLVPAAPVAVAPTWTGLYVGANGG